MRLILANNCNRVTAGKFKHTFFYGFIGNGEMFAASDAMAVAGITDRILYLAEGDVCEITPDAVDV